jgi:hypothetical protein
MAQHNQPIMNRLFLVLLVCLAGCSTQPTSHPKVYGRKSYEGHVTFGFEMLEFTPLRSSNTFLVDGRMPHELYEDLQSRPIQPDNRNGRGKAYSSYVKFVGQEYDQNQERWLRIVAIEKMGPPTPEYLESRAPAGN